MTANVSECTALSCLIIKRLTDYCSSSWSSNKCPAITPASERKETHAEEEEGELPTVDKDHNNSSECVCSQTQLLSSQSRKHEREITLSYIG